MKKVILPCHFTHQARSVMSWSSFFLFLIFFLLFPLIFGKNVASFAFWMLRLPWPGAYSANFTMPFLTSYEPTLSGQNSTKLKKENISTPQSGRVHLCRFSWRKTHLWTRIPWPCGQPLHRDRRPQFPSPSQCSCALSTPIQRAARENTPLEIFNIQYVFTDRMWHYSVILYIIIYRLRHGVLIVCSCLLVSSASASYKSI